MKLLTKHYDGTTAWDICAKYNIETDQIVGFGFNGYYFHFNIDKKLRQTMMLNKTVTFVWDPAYLLQLANKDMCKETEWISEASQDIGAVLGKF